MEIYLEYIILIIVSFLLAGLLAKFLRKAIDFFIKKNSEQLHTDPTNFIFLKNSVSFLCYSIALFWVFSKIPYFKNLGTALFASAGVLAAFIGFASQKAFSNIIGGIFILIFKPFRVGDNIEVVNGQKGIVEEITLRHTVLKDYEFRRIIIPNTILSDDTIINSSITDEKIRKHIDVNISYNADIELAENLIRTEIKKHPNFIDIRTENEIESNLKAIPVKVVKLGDYGVTLRAFVWTTDFKASTELYWDVLKSIKLAFDKHSIEIPNPHQSIIVTNASLLKEGTTKKN